MKNKFVLAFLMPLFIMVAVFGTGFSLWYFGDQQAMGAQTADVKVERIVDGNFGKFSYSLGNEDDEDYVSEEKIDKESYSPLLYVQQTGIEFVSPMNITFTFIEPTDKEAQPLTSYKFIFKYEIDLTGNFSKYFKVTAPKSSESANVEGYIPGYGDENGMKYDDIAKDASLATKSIMPISFDYKPQKTPTTLDQFKEIKDDLKNTSDMPASQQSRVVIKLSATAVSI